MAGQFLHGADAIATFEQARGKGVADDMAGRAFEGFLKDRLVLVIPALLARLRILLAIFLREGPLLEHHSAGSCRRHYAFNIQHIRYGEHATGMRTASLAVFRPRLMEFHGTSASRYPVNSLKIQSSSFIQR